MLHSTTTKTGKPRQTGCCQMRGERDSQAGFERVSAGTFKIVTIQKGSDLQSRSAKGGGGTFLTKTMARSEAVLEKPLEEMRNETIQAVIDEQSTKRIEKTRRPVVTMLKTEGCRRKQSERWPLLRDSEMDTEYRILTR